MGRRLKYSPPESRGFAEGLIASAPVHNARMWHCSIKHLIATPPSSFFSLPQRSSHQLRAMRPGWSQLHSIENDTAAIIRE